MRAFVGLCRALWKRGQGSGLNFYSLEEGPLLTATLDNAANTDIQMMFLMDLENSGKMWRLLAQMEKTRHNIIHMICTQLFTNFKA